MLLAGCANAATTTLSRAHYSYIGTASVNADIKFVGFQNFVDLFHDPIFWNAFGRSIYFLAGTVPAQLVLSLMLAMVLNNQLLKLSNLFRTMVFLPVVTPVAVIGIVWTFLLSPFNGPINGLLLDIGLIARPIAGITRSAKSGSVGGRSV